MAATDVIRYMRVTQPRSISTDCFITITCVVDHSTMGMMVVCGGGVVWLEKKRKEGTSTSVSEWSDRHRSFPPPLIFFISFLFGFLTLWVPPAPLSSVRSFSRILQGLDMERERDGGIVMLCDQGWKWGNVKALFFFSFFPFEICKMQCVGYVVLVRVPVSGGAQISQVEN